MDLFRYDKQVDPAISDNRRESPRPEAKVNKVDLSDTRTLDRGLSAFNSAMEAFGRKFTESKNANSRANAAVTYQQMRVEFNERLFELKESGIYDRDMLNSFYEEMLGSIDDRTENSQEAEYVKQQFSTMATDQIVDYLWKEGAENKKRSVDAYIGTAETYIKAQGEEGRRKSIHEAYDMVAREGLSMDLLATMPEAEFQADPAGRIGAAVSKEFVPIIIDAFNQSALTMYREEDVYEAARNYVIDNLTTMKRTDGKTPELTREQSNVIDNITNVLMKSSEPNRFQKIGEYFLLMNSFGLINEEVIGKYIPDQTVFQSYKVLVREIEKGKKYNPEDMSANYENIDAAFNAFIKAGGTSQIYNETQRIMVESQIEKVVERYGYMGAAEAMTARDEDGNWIIGDDSMSYAERVQRQESMFDRGKTEEKAAKLRETRIQDAMEQTLEKGIYSGQADLYTIAQGESGSMQGDFSGVHLDGERASKLRAMYNSLQMEKEKTADLDLASKQNDFAIRLADWSEKLNTNAFKSRAEAKEALQGIYAIYRNPNDPESVLVFQGHEYEKYDNKIDQMIESRMQTQKSTYYSELKSSGLPETILAEWEQQMAEARYNMYYDANGELRQNGPTIDEEQAAQRNIFAKVLSEAAARGDLKGREFKDMFENVSRGLVATSWTGKEYSSTIMTDYSKEKLSKDLDDQLRTQSPGKDIGRAIVWFNSGAGIAREGEFQEEIQKYGQYVTNAAEQIFGNVNIDRLYYDDGGMPIVSVRPMSRAQAEQVYANNFKDVSVANPEAAIRKIENGGNFILDVARNENSGWFGEKNTQYFRDFQEFGTIGPYTARRTDLTGIGSAMVIVDEASGVDTAIVYTPKGYRNVNELMRGVDGMVIERTEDGTSDVLVVGGQSYPIRIAK